MCLKAGTVIAKKGSTLTVTNIAGATAAVTTTGSTRYVAGLTIPGSSSLIRAGSLVAIQGTTKTRGQGLSATVTETATRVQILDSVCPPYSGG